MKTVFKCKAMLVSRAVPYAQIAEPNAIWIHTDQTETEKFPSVCI
jgi:hypothetical protein